MHRYAIIGAGFGSYGYRAALETLGYESYFVQRGREHEITEERVVIAVPPHAQPALAIQMMNKPDVRMLFLEKPLASTPGEALELLGELKDWHNGGNRHRTGRMFRIGYLFGDTAWARTGIKEIQWNFMAHHFANNLHNWKRNMGVSSFYGIHVVALLAGLGYNVANSSKEKDSCWTALFTGEGLPECRVTINAKSEKDEFIVNEEKLNSPFWYESRVDVLARSIQRFLDGPQPNYGAEIRLWEQVA